MKTGVLNQKQLPCVVEPDESCCPSERQEYLHHLYLNHRDSLQERLLAHGALLLRGLPVPTATEFAEFVRAFSGKPLLNYTGGASPRIKLCQGVYTSTEYSQSVTLSLHNELSYTYSWPSHLFFCCVKRAEQGGETPIADSRAILEGIDEEVLSRFKSRKIRYVRNLTGEAGSGFSWQDAFETFDRTAVESYCLRGGIDFRWRGDGGLRLSEVRPATIHHPVTGEEVWFNQADGFHPSALDKETYDALRSVMSEDEFRLNVQYGDGSRIEASALVHVREVMRRELVAVDWQAGDILILDNLLAAHGRMPFSGSRKILLAMT